MAAGALLCLLGGGYIPAQAQEPGTPAPTTATAAETADIPNEKPEVQILVMGLPTGQWAVSSTYPTRVAQNEVEARMKRLLQATGWKPLDGLRFSTDSTSFKTRQLNNMSSVSFVTADPVVPLSEGTLNPEPFLRAFSDLSRINITYFPPAGFTFRGLRRFSDKNLEIALAPGQGTFTYVVNIKNHNLDALSLPRYQEESSVAREPLSTPGGTGGLAHWGSIGALTLLAAGAGLATFLAAKAFAQRRG